jgi:hypothetical protein
MISLLIFLAAQAWSCMTGRVRLGRRVARPAYKPLGVRRGVIRPKTGPSQSQERQNAMRWVLSKVVVVGGAITNKKEISRKAYEQAIGREFDPCTFSRALKVRQELVWLAVGAHVGTWTCWGFPGANVHLGAAAGACRRPSHLDAKE